MANLRQTVKHEITLSASGVLALWDQCHSNLLCRKEFDCDLKQKTSPGQLNNIVNEVLKEKAPRGWDFLAAFEGPQQTSRLKREPLFVIC